MNDQLYKADAGKLRPSLLLEGMPRALLLVTAVLSYGAQKYEAHSWRKVHPSRYSDAKYRHMLQEIAGLGSEDEESGLLHDAHEVCNALFLLEQRMASLSKRQFKKFLEFNAPPQDHKNV